jgi:hypothetical protein
MERSSLQLIQHSLLGFLLHGKVRYCRFMDSIMLCGYGHYNFKLSTTNNASIEKLEMTTERMFSFHGRAFQGQT